MDQVKKRLDESVALFEGWKEIADAHMVNFICDNHWENIVPQPIQDIVSCRGTTWAIEQFWKHGRREPLENNSLTHFMEETSRMSLGVGDGICVEANHLEGVCMNSPLPPQQLMSPKKSHEVIAMSSLVKDISKMRCASHIIDIGGGKGYLSSFLAFQHSLKVLSLDSCDQKTFGAAKRVEKIQKHFKTVQSVTRACLYKQDTAFIDSNTNLMELIGRNFSDSSFKVGLVGLHTCGDLAPVSLKLFASVPEVDFVVNVGCCYHLMSDEEQNFPLSSFLKLEGFTLKRNPLMLALQAKTRFLSNETVPNESLMYRAVLQQLIGDRVQSVHELAGTVGRAAEKSNNFFEYVALGLKNLGLQDLEVSESEANDYMARCEPMREKLIIFFMLRVYVASVIENIILLDRLLYLMEEGFQESFLVQIFDPIISPRCHGIVAMKSP